MVAAGEIVTILPFRKYRKLLSLLLSLAEAVYGFKFRNTKSILFYFNSFNKVKNNISNIFANGTYLKNYRFRNLILDKENNTVYSTSTKRTVYLTY